MKNNSKRKIKEVPLTLEEIEYIQRHGSPAFSPEERAYLIEEGTDIGAYLREEQ